MAKGSFELIGGGLTYHFVDYGSAKNFSHKISPEGKLIGNLVYGFGITIYGSKNKNYYALRGFQGENSIAKPINGAIATFGTHSRNVEFGVVWGAYVQNEYDFRGTGVVPYSVGQGSNSIVPIIGVELNFKIFLKGALFTKFINVVTPIITNHSLSLGLDF